MNKRRHPITHKLQTFIERYDHAGRRVPPPMILLPERLCPPPLDPRLKKLAKGALRIGMNPRTIYANKEYEEQNAKYLKEIFEDDAQSVSTS